MGKIKDSLKDKELIKEVIRYIIVGIISTIIALATLWLFYDYCEIEKNLSNILSNIITMLVAYVLNRVFVFKSENKHVLEESSKFFISRIIVAIIDELLFFLLTFVIKEVLVIKIIVNIIVIVLNYIFSKLFIFKKNAWFLLIYIVKYA